MPINPGMLTEALAVVGRDEYPRLVEDGPPFQFIHQYSDLLIKIAPNVRKFHSSEYLNALATGEICFVVGFSGDIKQAQKRAAEAKSGVEVGYAIPKEGAQLWFDNLAIPKDAPHPDNAHLFIDYILRPHVIAAITDAVSYPNPNLAATALVNPTIRDDPGIYPPDAVRKLFYIDTPAPREYERARTRAWNRVKSGC